MQLNQAKELVAGLARPKEPEWVDLEGALGRVLALDLRASMDLPREARSRLDGFALNSQDTLTGAADRAVRLKIEEGLLAAGHQAGGSLPRGRCIRILTGAPLPPGADAVAPDEAVRREGAELIVEQAYDPRQGVAAAGGEVAAGELVLGRGAVLTPTRLALAAALGYIWIPCYQRPRVAVLATGDELRELGERLDGPYSYCNNRHLLAWLVQLHGGRVIHLGIARDDPEAIAERLAWADSDLVISTGGLGGGDRDCTVAAWDMLGVQVLFRRLNLSPGRNSALGTKGGRMFFGLPGSPWAAQVVFQELVAPALRYCQGHDSKEPNMVAATLGEPVTKTRGNCKAVRGRLDMAALPPVFTPEERKQGSEFDRLRDNPAYCVLDSEDTVVVAGCQVQARFLDAPLWAMASAGGE